MNEYIKALADDGSIYVIAEKLGLKPAGYYETAGYWEGESNPGFRFEFEITPVTGEDGLLTISEKDTLALKQLAAIVGKLYVQQGVGINYQFAANSESEADAVFLRIEKDGVSQRLD